MGKGAMTMYSKLLPIGSIVLLKKASKKLMITGIKPRKKDEPSVIYDYIGVLYPEGYLSNDYNFLFNHEDIIDVVFIGYQNPERTEFIEHLQRMSDEKISNNKPSGQ